MSSTNVLSQLQEQALRGTNAGTLTATMDGTTVTLVVREAGRLAVALEALQVSKPTQQADLAEIGRDLSGQLTYLLEPLALLEASAQQAVVRSMPPRRQGSTLEFYELWLRQGDEDLSLELTRMQAERKTRQRAALNLTWETLGHLLDDIHACLKS
jgi:hypothetical protein